MEITEESLFEIVEDLQGCSWGQNEGMPIPMKLSDWRRVAYEQATDVEGIEEDFNIDINEAFLQSSPIKVLENIEMIWGVKFSKPGEVENKISAQKKWFKKQMMETYPPIKPTPNIEFILLDKEKGKLQINAWNEEETSQLFCNVGLDEKFSKQSILGSGWTFNFQEFLFDELAKGLDIIEMTPDTHYNVMCTIKNDILWLAENDQEAFPDYYEGVKNYLDYCEKHNITKEFIEKETGLEPPEVQKIVDKSKKIFDESKYAKPKHDSVKGSESAGRGAIGRPVEKRI